MNKSQSLTLVAIGVIAVLLGVGALIAKSQSTYRIIFYGLSAIIIIKIIIVELMRIIKYYTG